MNINEFGNNVNREENNKILWIEAESTDIQQSTHRKTNMTVKAMKSCNRGFTLIELMIVIGIIGILAAIAIPQFSVYRTRSYNSASMNDLRNVANAQEAYYVDHGKYTGILNNLLTSDYGLVVSTGVSLNVDAGLNSYTITAYHVSGDKTYTLNGPGGSISS